MGIDDEYKDIINDFNILDDEKLTEQLLMGAANNISQNRSCSINIKPVIKVELHPEGVCCGTLKKTEKKSYDMFKSIKDKLTQTEKITYDIFNENKSIKEIAITREMTTKTIDSHLVQAFSKGYNLDMDRIGFNENIYNQVISVINSNEINGNITKLSPIRNLTGKKITYLHIKLAIAKMKMQKSENNIVII